MAEEQMVVTSNPTKKIGFFAAILVVIGSTIGVGIFLRAKTVLENSAGNILWAILIWLIAGFAVITLALALVEVASGRNDNLGMIGWSKAFNTLAIYKANKFFMTYLYLPLTYFFMPYYVIVQFQDALTGFGITNPNFGAAAPAAPWIYFAIGLVMTVWMLFSAGLSGRAGNIQNIIITSFKFIPLVAIVIIGFIFFGQRVQTHDTTFWTPVTAEALFKKDSTSFLGLTPFLGIFGSFAGIFFAFDGFYVSAGIQSEMKNPEKTPAVLVVGLFSITAIYTIIALSMSLGAKTGGFYDFGEKLGTAGHGWAFGVINICIAIGVLGVLNGFSMWCTRFVEDLVKEGEIYVSPKIYRYMKNSNMPIVGALFSLILSVPLALILTVIGAYAYIGTTWSYVDKTYGNHMSSLLSFSDLMADWMAVFSFAFIVMAVVGVLENRKKNFIEVEKNRHTVWAGTIAVIMVMGTVLFKMIDPFISLGLSIAKKSTNDIIGYAATSGLFIAYVIFMFAATPIEKMLALRRKEKLDAAIKVADNEESIAEINEAKELNDLVLQTFETAR
ncbi:APC family permease [Metamycoplasma auris]|uniref:Amino acid/polyamine/organocation transporter (APC superfamily) n=1 Tax=Metamycoplasma auris TaxID=51363 RepID=A0A2W7HXC2_9BACT|nr:amino acid permease [Metamycoplasma auris]PZV99845.1 amino acid/polyamine/organocation transporter (APC superfamily) [Metamycoplasma auris]